MFVISYRNQEHPRVFAVPDNFEPGYADVLVKTSGHLRQQVSREEMIRVLRFVDPVAASKFYGTTRFRSVKEEERRLADGYEEAFDVCDRQCEDFNLYQPTEPEEFVTMSNPPIPGQKPTASAQAPKGAEGAGAGQAKSDPKPAKEKKAAPPREKKYPDGATGASKITLGANKDGKRYGADNNPKKGASAQRFGLYRDGMTVDEALKAGVTLADIRWDADPKRALIKLS